MSDVTHGTTRYGFDQKVNHAEGEEIKNIDFENFTPSRSPGGNNFRKSSYEEELKPSFAAKNLDLELEMIQEEPNQDFATQAIQINDYKIVEESGAPVVSEEPNEKIDDGCELKATPEKADSEQPTDTKPESVPKPRNLEVKFEDEDEEDQDFDMERYIRFKNDCPTPADMIETLSALSILKGSFSESEECTNPLPNINMILRQLKRQRKLAGLDADEQYDKIIIREQDSESNDEDYKEPEDKTGYKLAWTFYQSKRKWKSSWIKEEPEVLIQDQNEDEGVAG
jgi:hypothetical protein